MKEIEKLREQIDEIDGSIVELLKKRMDCVHRVGEIKAVEGSALFVPERESAQREKLVRLNGGVLPEEALLSIYRQIISCGYLLEGGLRIGYLGPEGTWSHQAALARFGESVHLQPFPSFSHVFEAAERGEVDYAVVPIENSTDGFVTQTMDLLMTSSRLRICAQIHLNIRNCLLSNVAREDIRVIYSHPQVLGQCRHWLQQNFPQAEQISTASTAAAAKISPAIPRASLSSGLNTRTPPEKIDPPSASACPTVRAHSPTYSPFSRSTASTSTALIPVRHATLHGNTCFRSMWRGTRRQNP